MYSKRVVVSSARMFWTDFINDYLKEYTPAIEDAGGIYCETDDTHRLENGDKAMQKTILITGSTDGIGLETARMLVPLGHKVLLHGRNPEKIKKVTEALLKFRDGGRVESYISDLSRMADVEALAKAVTEKHAKLDVLINNAGIFKVPNPKTSDGLDFRFAVNTIAPYLLTRRLLQIIDKSGRVINVSSAAQASVDPAALAGQVQLSDMAAYSQSKLALTMWSCAIANSLGDDGPQIIAVNPASMLGSKMVKQVFGVAGKDLRIGAEILCRLSLSDEFATASGQYFDNDIGRFASPHPDAMDSQKSEEIVGVIEAILKIEKLTGGRR